MRFAGNLKLTHSLGLYRSIYERNPSISAAAMCAKDAQIMYALPVAGSYCKAGVDAGLGRIAALYHRSSSLYHIRSDIRCLYFEATMRPNPRWTPTPFSSR